ncbi:MAG TPA: MFS transporter [Tepidisphaeraceae bacterium]|jgi:MFS family permease|nr:MFS transporter [Tepidisphaeraceae bacterium]
MLTEGASEFPAPASPARGARSALTLLLLINLFNYIDRYVLAAVEPAIQKDFFPKNPPNAEALMGLLATAFIVSYMITAPIFGWLADRGSRWLIIGASVLVWSLATGASGLSGIFGGFALLFITRLFVGIGEGGYGPAAPTLLSDYFPIAHRGIVLSCFYLAIPVGSALGFVIGGKIADYFHSWHAAFYAVVIPGLLMGIACFFFRDPPRGQADGAHGPPRLGSLHDYMALLRNRSYVLNSLGMTAMTFAIGGISFWIPKYLVDRGNAGTLAEVNYKFGLITVVAGFLATLLGGLVGDFVQKWFASSYLLVSGIAMFIACPFVLKMLDAPFPLAWVYLGLAIFFMFFNTGPTNTALANVSHPSVRATAFALNILIIHALGDAAAPPILGKIAHVAGWNRAFQLVAAMMALAGVFWIWGSFYLARDTQAASRDVAPGGFPVIPPMG